MTWSLRISAIVIAMALLALPGCGPSKVKVTGKLLKDGQPYAVSKETMVTLIFSPDAEVQTQTYPANFKHDTGTYEVEMPPGKYRARYVIVEKDQAPFSAPEAFKSKSHDLSRSQQLDLDIGAK